jgi:transcriptional regulator with XRE-family HTH domain
MKSESNKKSVPHAQAGLVHLSPAVIIGLEIRRQREARRWTQKRLADLAGTTQTSIAHLEAGRRNPTLGLLERVARAMKMEFVLGLRRKLGD